MSGDAAESYELVFLLGLSFQLLIEEFRARTDAAGYDDLRPVHGFAFQALGPEGATSSELADRLGVTRQAAGQMVDHLEDRGYAQRTDHPLGGRRRLVVLTELGQQHLRDAGAILHALEREWEARIGSEAFRALRADLATLVGAAAGGRFPPLRPIW